MGRTNYEFGTTPRKLKPEYKPNKDKQKEIQKQKKINEEQKKAAIKMEKRMQLKNVALIVAIFLILLTISYRSSLINERFNEIQTQKNNLSAIEKTNGQLEVSIESSLNLSNIEESAKEKLGMQKLDNSQKVYVALDKKDYVEVIEDDIETEEKEDPWYKKIINKFIK